MFILLSNKMIYNPTYSYFRSSVESVIETIAHLQVKEEWSVSNMRSVVSRIDAIDQQQMKHVVIEGDTKT